MKTKHQFRQFQLAKLKDNHRTQMPQETDTQLISDLNTLANPETTYRTRDGRAFQGDWLHHGQRLGRFGLCQRRPHPHAMSGHP